MSGFLCCWMWLLVGLLLGWLAHWLFDKLFGRDGDEAGARWKREYDAVNAKLSSLQTDLNAANSKAGKIQGEFDASKAKVSGLENDLNAHLASLKAKNEELNKLGAENADLRARLGNVENQAKASGAAAAAAAATAAAATALATAGGFGFVPQKNGQDDLIIIEGIGPKIKELLHADGIKTFEALAQAPVSRIQGILDAAGPNFRLAKPASWARQAAMCAAGDWASLRKYQDELVAGVDPDAPKA